MCVLLQGTLGRYFATVHCPICNELTNEGVCPCCRGNPQLVATVLSQQIHDIESAHHSVTMVSEWLLGGGGGGGGQFCSWAKLTIILCHCITVEPE